MVFVTHFVSKFISYLLIVYLYFMHDGSRLGEANPTLINQIESWKCVTITVLKFHHCSGAAGVRMCANLEYLTLQCENSIYFSMFLVVYYW